MYRDFTTSAVGVRRIGQYVGLIVLVVGVAAALTAAAFVPMLAAADVDDQWDEAYGEETPSWTPPPPPFGADIDEQDWILMWSGMETIDGDIIDGLSDSDGDYTENQAVYVTAARQDVLQTTPPREPVEWNQATGINFGGGDRFTSIYPPGADRTDGEYIKDAYIEIAEPTPSTRYHTDDEVIHLVTEDGGLLVSSDYRIEGPVDTTGSNIRQSFEFAGTSQSDINITADGEEITEDTTNARGGSYITYEDLNGQDATITVRQEFNVTYIQETEEFLCDDIECSSRSWELTDTTNLTDSVVVSDTIEVEVEDDEGHLDVRRGNDRDYVQFDAPEYWSGLEIGADETGHISSEVAFVTTRDRQWDTLVADDGEEQEPVDHIFTPVQTHAIPAYEGLFHTTAAAETVGSDTLSTNVGPETEYPTQPPNVDISTSTERNTYREVESATIRIDGLENPPNPYSTVESPKNIEFTPLVYGNDFTTEATPRQDSRPSNLTIDAAPMYAGESDTEPTHYRVTVELWDEAADQPIKTQDTNRTIRINNQFDVETYESGRGVLTLDAEDRAPTGFTGEFIPQHPFEEDVHYEPAEDETAIPVEYIHIADIANTFANDVALPVFFIILPFLVLWVIYRVGMYGRFPTFGRT